VKAGVENGAMLTTFIYSDILQNAPFRSQFFKIFSASGGKGALTLNQNPANAIERTCRRNFYRVTLCARPMHSSYKFFLTCHIPETA